MKQPEPLKKNDSVGIISPARVITKRQVDYAISLIENWRLNIIVGKNTFSQFGYFAGTDEQRAGDLQKMLDNPSIKAIFCSRGGYGMTRIIDQLDFTKFLMNPKWIVGFSDITALHLKLNKLGIQSIHGIMPVQYDHMGMEEPLASLKKLLFGKSVNYQLEGTNFNQHGRAFAEIVGGNLSLLVESLGTKTELNSTHKILFIEEIDEYLYKIDRMLNQLSRAGKLDQIDGLIIGQFTSTKDTSIPFGQTLEEIVLQFFKDRQIPICFDFPVGHDHRNLAIPCGRKLGYSVSKDGVILSG